MERQNSYQSEMPQEARLLIADFLQKEQLTTAQKEPKRGKPVARLFRGRRGMTAKEIERHARSTGFEVRGGNGKHGKHIEDFQGHSHPLPDHGSRSISLGVINSIASFIESHQNCAA